MTAELPIRSERLVIRAMRADDAPVFAAYRDDPVIAKYQDWDLPYTVADAERFVEEQSRLTWPALGEWIQLAVVHDGEMIGDVAVGRSADGHTASLGYTFAAIHHGRGFATEAAATVVDRLFAEGVHRVAATADPHNHASARVLERIGFRYEGRAVASAFVRGEWLDEDRYAVLADERTSWLTRDLQPPDAVRLVEITPANRVEVGHITTHHSQEQFVTPVLGSYRDALVPEPDPAGGTVVPWMRAIEADGTLVGFMMLAEATATNPDPFLWRLLIGRWHQGRGIGRRAIGELVERLRREGHRRLLVSWHPGPGGPEGFYLGLGFVPTGEVEHGETIAGLDI